MGSIRGPLLAIASVMVTACGGGSEAAMPPDAPAPDAGSMDAPAARCPNRVIHFAVHPVVAGAAIPNGRVLVDFAQFNDDLMLRPPRFIGYDRPFAGTATTLDIATDDIALPQKLGDYQLCERACKDLTDPTCGCKAGGPKIALALVGVYIDPDGSGAIEPGERAFANQIGAGYTILGAADTAYAAGTVLDELLPQGIVDCIAPYEILPPPANSSFNDLGIRASDAPFPLDVCAPPDASCDDVRFPNVS
jgi:hypothetical protein